MTRSIPISSLRAVFQIWRTGKVANKARLRPCRGLNDPVALSKDTHLRKEHGRKNDPTGLCIDAVSALLAER